MSATAFESEGLKVAFEAFNRHSSRLASSYEELRQEVDRLRRELASSQRTAVAAQNERERLGNRLARTLEALPGALIMLDGDGIIRETNSRAAVLLNRPLIGLAWADIVRRECVPKAASSGELRMADGRWLNLSRQRLGSEPGEILLLTDVSESRRMSEMLERAERLSCLGEMTASLAHQIRTPLASALLNAARLRGDDEQVSLAARIRDRLNEIGRMTNDMLRFTAGARRGGERFNVPALLTDLLETCDNGSDDLEVTLARTDFHSCGNRDAIKGALCNLVDNARQACGDDARIELGAEYSGGRLCLTVTDNGHGIAEHVRRRLFEPFFTTRPQGTGLGLAVVHAVAEAHDGEVLVDSRPSGTTFALCLPTAGIDSMEVSGD